MTPHRRLIELEGEVAERDARLRDAESTVARQQKLHPLFENRLSIIQEEFNIRMNPGQLPNEQQAQPEKVTELLRTIALLRKDLADNANYKTEAQSIAEGRFGIPIRNVEEQLHLLEGHVVDGCSSLILKEFPPASMT